MCLTDVHKPPTGEQPQAAEPSDFEADLVAVFVVPALADESEVVDEDESEDVLPDPLAAVEGRVEPETVWEWLPELVEEPPLGPVFRRESLRESLR